MCHFTAEDMEASLDEWVHDPEERARIRRDAYGALGDASYDAGDVGEARNWYIHALRAGGTPRIALKYLLIRAGRVGGHVRSALAMRS
jgi:hypothetical protein